MHETAGVLRDTESPGTMALFRWRSRQMDAVAVDGARTAIQVGLEATLRPRGVLGMFKAKSRMSPHFSTFCRPLNSNVMCHLIEFPAYDRI